MLQGDCGLCYRGCYRYLNFFRFTHNGNSKTYLVLTRPLKSWPGCLDQLFLLLNFAVHFNTKVIFISTLYSVISLFSTETY